MTTVVASPRRYEILARPESFRSATDGCVVADHCQDCPLPECTPGAKGLLLLKNLLRDKRVRASAREGMAPAAIALQESIEKRTVYRILARS